MALPVTDTQGTQFYLVGANVDIADVAKIETAKAAGKQVLCMQDFADLTETRNIQEYTCMSSDESTKSSGSITLGNGEASMLFDAKDTAGQADFRAMWENNERRQMIIELSDLDGGTNPTYITYSFLLSSQSLPIPKDAAVMFNVTIEQSSRFKIHPAT